MASGNPNRTPMYPEVIQSNPNEPSVSNSSKSSLYPQIDMKDLVENLFPENYQISPEPTPSAPPESVEEVLLTFPGAILHLIDKHYSVELASGDLSIVRLLQGDSVLAILVRIADEIQWPLAKDEATVKLDDWHYFFSLSAPRERDSSSDSSDDEDAANGSNSLLNYGLTIVSKGQEGLLAKFDKILERHSRFSVRKVSEALDGTAAKEVSTADLEEENKKELVEQRCAAYWTTLAPNVEEYSGTAAKLIAAGSGQLIKGILWCGDVTVERLKWGNEVLKNRMEPGSKEISPETLKKIQRVKKMTKMTEKVANGVLSGVVKVSGYFTSSVANSKMGKKFFDLLPGEIVLASLDGFGKVCDAVEIAGKNVMSTSSTVTTGLVSHRRIFL
ncbi:protein EARLY-RESPONSIVE TO DEHYDRATION 7, chloroplastic isoform X2 [Diospyros lotus]|uniref:protein EARLY-RESPONSIVE TO DEHYDRATION 7, chloroplastic isoform X2 n=1 Tax=Diospyros lotus TaxID=55363 RepID=UPI00225BA2CE|nr:protein EARLY-RESPONSIVE TO DEHYDRATION 7, chloroplastic isoform X2 [Diospyros lotus]